MRWLLRFWRWEHRDLAVVAAALALEGYIACGCAPRPQVVEPAGAPAPPWCFHVTARFDGRYQAGVVCGETEALCGNAQRRAVRWGGVAGLKEVGSCSRR